MGSAGTSFRSDRRAGAAGRADACRAIWIFAGNTLADYWRGARRMRAGFRNFILLDAARRKIARPNGSRRSEPARRIHRANCRAGDHDYFAGGGRTGCSERAEIFAVGNVYAGDDNSHRHVDGTLFALLAAGAGVGGVGNRSFAGAARCCCWPMGGGRAIVGANFFTFSSGAGGRTDYLWIRSFGAAGLVVAGSARLLERVY